MDLLMLMKRLNATNLLYLNRKLDREYETVTQSIESIKQQLANPDIDNYRKTKLENAYEKQKKTQEAIKYVKRAGLRTGVQLGPNGNLKTDLALEDMPIIPNKIIDNLPDHLFFKNDMRYGTANIPQTTYNVKWAH